MAVSGNYEIKTYILDGVAVQFAIPFDVSVDDYGNAINIVVNLGLDELIVNVDYTIAGKTINYPDAVSHTGEKLTVFRRTPIEQPVDFVDNGNFTLEDIETGLDRSIMIEQETSANLDNTVRAQESAEKAEQYRDEARASELNAKESEDNAYASAQNASASEGDAAVSALVAEGWAKGTQNGTPVESGDYYQDNSKYYKEQAGTSATSASASATKASEWADKAEDSEVEAGRYSAKHWAAKASTRAGAASVSAFNAGQSEIKAGKWAEEDEDVEVETGKYSAKHYAAKADDARIDTVSETISPDDGGTNTITMTYKDGTQKTFTVTNGSKGSTGATGNGIASVSLVSGTHSPGTVDTYRITFDDSTHEDFTVYNGANGSHSTVTVSADTTVTPIEGATYVVDTASVTITLGSGLYIGQEVRILALASCTVAFTDTGGTSQTAGMDSGDIAHLTWGGTGWATMRMTGTYTDNTPFSYLI